MKVRKIININEARKILAKGGKLYIRVNESEENKYGVFGKVLTRKEFDALVEPDNVSSEEYYIYEFRKELYEDCIYIQQKINIE